MAADGDIDYRSFSPAQLEEALAWIDRERFPLNHQNLAAEIERRRAEADAGAPRAPVRYKVEFKADPKEYFRIWIVNLALTIVTAGIYSAWAKVRKLRYFYGSTSLAGSAFGYHADPLKILKGRIIAVLLAGAYFAARRTSELATLTIIVLFVIATPWLVVKSRTFAMRVTSWRGLRFDFTPDYAGAYRVFVGWLVIGFLTFGLMLPRFVRERYRYVVSRSRYGATAFDCDPAVGRFYKTVFVAGGLAIAVAFVVGITLSAIGGFVRHALGVPATGKFAGIMGILTVMLTYALMLPVIHGYSQARNLNEVIGHTSLGRHRLVSSLSAERLIKIYLINLLGIVFTLGFYTPWAEVRLRRYRAQAVELEAHASLDEFVAAARAEVPAAAGEEISSFFDIDFGF